MAEDGTAPDSCLLINPRRTNGAKESFSVKYVSNCESVIYTFISIISAYVYMYSSINASVRATVGYCHTYLCMARFPTDQVGVSGINGLVTHIRRR